MTKNRVLIVEDEISIAKMINMNLKVANYDTVMFHDGDEAAKALEEEHDYDIALLDQTKREKNAFILYYSRRNRPAPPEIA